MKILLVSFDWLGLASPIVEELEAQGHEVTFLDSRDIGYFEYWNKPQRLLNACSRLFSSQSLKSRHIKWSERRFLEGFCVGRSFDLTIFTDPTDINDEYFEVFRQFSSRMVAIMWDSVGRRPKYLERAQRFDKVFAFDPVDVEQYGFAPITNYIAPSIKPFPSDRECSGELFTVMAYDRTRYEFLQKLLDANPALKYRFAVVFERRRNAKKATDPRIESLENPILGEDLYSIIAGYSAILDVGHQNQSGLSFRVFESLGHEQKLVTTNQAIKNTPLYVPENVYCVDVENPVIDPSFFQTPYKPMPRELVEYYQLSNWVRRLLETR